MAKRLIDVLRNMGIVGNGDGFPLTNEEKQAIATAPDLRNQSFRITDLASDKEIATRLEKFAGVANIRIQ